MVSKFSIVLGTVNKKKYSAFYESLRRINYPFHLIVSDASDGSYVDVLSLKFPIKNIESFTIIKDSPPSGYIKAYNKAFATVTTEWVIWLNDDCEILPGWDTAIMAWISNVENNNKIGAIYFRNDTRTNYKSTDSRGMMFANFGVIHRDLGAKLGWFDDRLFFYSGDSLICFKAMVLYDVSVVPIEGAKINHPQERKNNTWEKLLMDDCAVALNVHREIIEEKSKLSGGKIDIEVLEEGTRLWFWNSDIQSRFPRFWEPSCIDQITGLNYLAWMRKCGIYEKPEIAEYFFARDSRPAKIEFGCFSDSRGTLVVGEDTQHIKFQIKSILWFGVENDNQEIPGNSGKLAMVAMSGSFDVLLTDPDGRESVFRLDNKETGLYVPDGYRTKVQNLSKDSVCLVLTSK